MSNSQHWHRVEWLFEQALLLTPEERSDFLQQACSDDAAIQEEVESLLIADRQAGSFLEKPALNQSSIHPTRFPSSLPVDPSQIGPYRILSELGEGGMSMVYLASRSDWPESFRVAIKLVRPGMFMEGACQRFQQECRILAALHHPHIAQLLDSGTSEDGRPYFVMEYVAGVTIDEYCEAQQLSVEKRLRLFQDVCSAVDYAHRNLVVHRDLKPNNILVTADGVVKLLDFGIAKLLHPDMAQTPQEQTTASRCFWTPQCASPEQVQGKSVTTASDIYSLGVLLFKLLSGQRPYCLDRFSAQEMERVICEVEPSAPSEAVHRSGGEAKLCRRLIGDLDNIVLMSLRKEPERRYASIQDFSADIRCHLNGLPVSARKSTFSYRSGKFIRRHAVGVGASIVVFVSLLAGTVVSIWQARAALEQRHAAEIQRANAEQVSSFLAGLFKVADPAEAQGRQVTVREMLDRSAVRLQQELQGQPQVRATLMDTVGVVYGSLGLFEPAERMLQESQKERLRLLGPNRPEVAESLAHLASLRYAQFRPREAAELSRQALAIRLEVFGPDNPKVAESLQTLADALQITDQPEVEDLLHRVLAIRRKMAGDNDPQVAQTLQALGWWLITRDRYEEAEPVYAQVLAVQRRELGPDHEATLLTLSNLAILRLRQGRYMEAEKLFRETLSGWRRVKGEDHPEIAAFESALAVALCARGRLKESEILQRRALSLRRLQWGDEHPAVDNSLNHLAVVLYREGRYAQAEILLWQALRMRINRWGEDHRSVADTLVNLAQVRLARGDAAGAETMFRQGLGKWQTLLGEEHPATAGAMDGLAHSLAAQGNLDSAAQFLQKALSIREKILGTTHPEVAESLTGLGQLWLSTDPKRAEALLRRAFNIRRNTLGKDHWATAESESALGECLRVLKRREEAQPLLRESYFILKTSLGDRHPLTLEAFSRLKLLKTNSG